MFTDIKEFLCEFGIPLFLIVLFVVIPVLIIVISFQYYSDCYSANIYNEKMGTSYTCSDFFWAGNQINERTINLNTK